VRGSRHCYRPRFAAPSPRTTAGILPVPTALDPAVGDLCRFVVVAARVGLSVVGMP